MTQGRGDGHEWVTAFMISYSMNAFNWYYVKDQYGNQKVRIATFLNHDMSVSPANTQISLAIHPVWSESALSCDAQWVIKDKSFLHVDSDQAELMPRLIWVFLWRIAKVLYLLSWFIYEETPHSILMKTM